MDAIKFTELLKGHLHDPDFAGLSDISPEIAHEFEKLRVPNTFLLVTLPPTEGEEGHGGRFVISVTQVK